MHTWAVLAAKEAVIASGLGAGVVPAIGAGSLDSFAIGALMSGTCILMLTSPRRGRWRGLAAAHGAARGLGADGEVVVRAAAEAGPGAGEAGPGTGEAGPATGGAGPATGGAGSVTGGAGSVTGGADSATGDRQDVTSSGGYQSRHRLPEPNPSPQRQAGGRSVPRHARRPPVSAAG